MHIHSYLGAALVAATVLAAPARADVLTFDDLAGVGATVGGTAITTGAFSLGFYANTDTNGIGATVGQFVTPGTFDCSRSIACPTNDPSTYYAALNAGILEVTATSGASISVQGFDASFIGSGASLSGYPAVAGLLGIQGTTASGDTYVQSYALAGPGADGFAFSRYSTIDGFGSLAFTDVIFFSYVCDAFGSCSFSGNPKEQFALDNIVLTVNPIAPPAGVPEPASLALFGLGLAGLATAARRRRQS